MSEKMSAAAEALRMIGLDPVGYDIAKLAGFLSSYCCEPAEIDLRTLRENADMAAYPETPATWERMSEADWWEA